MENKNVGKVVQIIGPVLDIKFQAGQLPNLLNAIEIEFNGQNALPKLPSTWATTWCAALP